MADSDDFNEISVDISEVTPLRVIALEVHELQRELEAVGFPPKLLAEVIAHLLFDLLLYRSGDPEEEAEFDEDEDEEDDLEDGEPF